jgi:hypothetical protein
LINTEKAGIATNRLCTNRIQAHKKAILYQYRWLFISSVVLSMHDETSRLGMFHSIDNRYVKDIYYQRKVDANEL